MKGREANSSKLKPVRLSYLNYIANSKPDSQASSILQISHQNDDTAALHMCIAAFFTACSCCAIRISSKILLCSSVLYLFFTLIVASVFYSKSTPLTYYLAAILQLRSYQKQLQSTYISKFSFGGVSQTYYRDSMLHIQLTFSSVCTTSFIRKLWLWTELLRYSWHLFH